MKEKGFTLAEILITLTIIGVVAAITIPAVTHNIQDMQYKTAWKSMFADINQVNKKILLSNAGSFKGICADGATDCLRDKFLSYLSYTKKCGGASNICWTAGTGKTANGIIIDDGSIGTSAVLNNGILVMFANAKLNCDYTNNSISACGKIWVDVNGLKGPNIIGKDIFILWVLENTIKPLGTTEDGYICTPLYAYGCSAKYLME